MASEAHVDNGSCRHVCVPANSSVHISDSQLTRSNEICGNEGSGLHAVRVEALCLLMTNVEGVEKRHWPRRCDATIQLGGSGHSYLATDLSSVGRPQYDRTSRRAHFVNHKGWNCTKSPLIRFSKFQKSNNYSSASSPTISKAAQARFINNGRIRNNPLRYSFPHKSTLLLVPQPLESPRQPQLQKPPVQNILDRVPRHRTYL